jgi:hypothetical protein
MPEGSSSAAPVMKPGPRIFKNFFIFFTGSSATGRIVESRCRTPIWPTRHGRVAGGGVSVVAPAALGNATSCALAALPIAKTPLTDLLPRDIALDRYGLFVSRTTQLDSIKTQGIRTNTPLAHARVRQSSFRFVVPSSTQDRTCLCTASPVTLAA